ncbi:MAG: 16S rRNA (cytosine(967)-C(5))-methyltransferase [Cyanothece sp. SIO2G6]|nr:16S rRNA (cytosine(967)-C(5))-methyltransferase [Cyanothece sp. SIO2G6]
MAAQQNPRQLTLQALQRVQRGTFADVALDQILRSSKLEQRDRRLVTELVYGSIRQQRTLDALIAQFSRKPNAQYPVNLQLILRLGFYQLRYLNHIPPSAAVNTTVELAKANGLSGFKGFVNGVLRQYVRLRATNSRTTIAESMLADPLRLPDDEVERLGILHSYPNWIIEAWLAMWDVEAVTQLCHWFNQPPSIDLRVNSEQVSVQAVEAALQTVSLAYTKVNGLPQALRLLERPGQIQSLPGFQEGWWSIQDTSAQLVGYLLDPQPGESIIDACAAPGGKTTHIAELMGDKGTVWACDRNPSRLRKVTENSGRLRLKSIKTHARDCSVRDGNMDDTNQTATAFFAEEEIADRVLVDAPCSGLGTLHRHADARWRQTAAGIGKLADLQVQLLTQTARWLKPGGTLVYSTCTLLAEENEAVVTRFLDHHPQWSLSPPIAQPLFEPYLQPEGWLTVWPHHHDMDGFFMARLRRD